MMRRGSGEGEHRLLAGGQLLQKERRRPVLKRWPNAGFGLGKVHLKLGGQYLSEEAARHHPRGGALVVVNLGLARVPHARIQPKS